MRIITGGIVHETSTFTPVKITWESYTNHFYLAKQEILETFQGTNTPIGGFIEGADKHNFDLIPTLFATAHPGGATPRDIFDSMLHELLDSIRQAGKIDGALLYLHGSMVVGDLDQPDGIDDADGFILQAVRKTVGENIPVVVELDIHSNVTPKMVEMADVLIGRETYPEVDMAERGRECADVLARILNEGLRPTMALRQIPMVWGLNQVTAHPPMSEAIAKLHELEQQPGVVCASIAVCYFLADVPDMGSSVYVVTDNDLALAQQSVDQLAEWIFARRADWHYELPSTRQAIEIAIRKDRYPVIFADSRDNPGGGAPGDSTGMLQTFLNEGLQDACLLYIVDPDVARACHEAGIGAELELNVGAKASPLQGNPVSMKATVMGLSDGKFHYDGPMYAGLQGNMGTSAWIQQDGIHVIVVTEREQPFDTAFTRSLGLDPQTMKYIGVKSTAHFRAGFEPWAGAIYVVSEPCVHNLGNLPFHRLRHKTYPFDDIQEMP